MTDFNIGDKIRHPHHGNGVISSISPGRTFAVCKYPTKWSKSVDDFYSRTHRISDLTLIEKASSR